MRIFQPALAAVFAASHAFAQTAFTGIYTWGANGNTNSFDYNGTNIANLTESPFTKTANVGISSSSGNFRGTNWALDPVTGTLTGTNDPSKYFEFSFTTDAGFRFDMTNLSFGLGSNGTGAGTFA